MRMFSKWENLAKLAYFMNINFFVLKTLVPASSSVSFPLEAEHIIKRPFSFPLPFSVF